MSELPHRCRGSSPLARNDARLPCRAAASQQGHALPSGPSHGRGDRGRHAHRRRRRPRPPAARPDRPALARRAADQRSAGARRGGSRPASRLGARAPRQGRPSPRGRHGRLGVGAAAPVAGYPPRVAGRPVVLRHHSADPRTSVVKRRRPCRATPRSRGGRHPAPPRTPPSFVTLTPSRWLMRDAADRHTAPART
jgi:hypothetical protein